MRSSRTIPAAVAIMACVALALTTLRVGAQTYPTSPAAGPARLTGQQVTVYFNHNSAASGSRTRESSGTDPLVRINDALVSVSGTVSDFSTQGGGRWMVLTRRNSGHVWIPLDSIQMIEVAEQR